MQLTSALTVWRCTCAVVLIPAQELRLVHGRDSPWTALLIQHVPFSHMPQLQLVRWIDDTALVQEPYAQKISRMCHHHVCGKFAK